MLKDTKGARLATSYPYHPLSTFPCRPSFHDLVNRWLERTPFVSEDESQADGQPLFSFWQHYEQGVGRMLDDDRDFIMAGKTDDADPERLAQIEKQVAELEKRKDHLDIIISAEKFNEAQERGEVRCGLTLPSSLYITDSVTDSRRRPCVLL